MTVTGIVTGVAAVLVVLWVAAVFAGGEQHAAPETMLEHMWHELWHSMYPAIGGAIGLGIAGRIAYNRKRKK